MLSTDFASEIQKLSPSAMVELYEIDATALGGSLLRFHAGTNGLQQNLVWQGNTYVRFPVTITGFEFSGQGQFPRPKMQVSNALSAVTVLLMEYGDLLGAKVTRRRTLQKYLDAVNFPGGVNPTADPLSEVSPDVYFVDQKTSEDFETVELSLAASVDLVGVQLPRRQIIQNVCAWKYRSAECGYAGAPVADQNDNPLTAAPTAAGQNVLNLAAKANTAYTALQAAISALSISTYAQGSACTLVLQNTKFDLVQGGGNATPLNYSGQNGIAVTTSLLPSAPYSSIVAFYNGARVTLSTNYRQAATLNSSVTDTQYQRRTDLYNIEFWDVGAGCAAATTTQNAAVTAKANAQTAYNTALANYQAAVAALPAGDPLMALDVCGKRLSSCKLRFGANNPLSYGGFVGAGLSS